MTVVRAASAAGAAVVTFAIAMRFGPLADAGSTVAGPNAMAAWMWPPVAAIVVAGIVVAMGGVGRDVGTGTAMVACETCGGSVRSEWRLCPHCGTRLGKKEVDDASERRTEKGKSDG